MSLLSISKGLRSGTALQLKAERLKSPAKGYVVIEDGNVTNLRTGESVSLDGAHADVDSAGQIDKRITASRLLLAGPFALAMKKSKDNRDLFLTVTGSDGGFLIEVDPKKQADARRFALNVNTAAKLAVA